MKLVDLVAKIFFGSNSSNGFYKAKGNQKKDTYVLTSIFPNTEIENMVLSHNKA